MGRKLHPADQIIGKLRIAEIETANGQTSGHPRSNRRQQRRVADGEQRTNSDTAV